MTFATKFEPAEDETVDPCTTILIDGKEVGYVQHCLGGEFVLDRCLYDAAGEFEGSQFLGEYRTLALAIAAAKNEWSAK